MRDRNAVDVREKEDMEQRRILYKEAKPAFYQKLVGPQRCDFG